jgi:hypothetical protein
MHPIGRRPAWAGVLFATTTLLAIAAPRQAKGEALELKNCEILLPTGKCIKWAANTAGLDFSVIDAVDSGAFNRILWEGLMGDRPYPTGRSGQDLSTNREALLASANAGRAVVE